MDKVIFLNPNMKEVRSDFGAAYKVTITAAALHRNGQADPFVSASFTLEYLQTGAKTPLIGLFFFSSALKPDGKTLYEDASFPQVAVFDADKLTFDNPYRGDKYVAIMQAAYYMAIAEAIRNSSGVGHVGPSSVASRKD